MNNKSNSASMATQEEFWGINLSSELMTHTWDPANDDQKIGHKIQVTQACLGATAKDGERNVVEVATEDDHGRKISCSVVSLRDGLFECMHLDLGFTNAVTFTLTEGSGPVSLCGLHLMLLPISLSDEESIGRDEEMIPKSMGSDMEKMKETEAVVVDRRETAVESASVEDADDDQCEKLKSEDKDAVMVVEVMAGKSKKRLASDESEVVVAKRRKRVNGSVKVKRNMAFISSDEDVDDKDEDSIAEDEAGNEATEELFVLTEAMEVNDEESESGDEEPEFGDDIESEDTDDDDDEDDQDDSEYSDMTDFIVNDETETDEDELDSDDEDDDDDDDDDDDEDDEDSEDNGKEASPTKNKQSTKTNKKQPAKSKTLTSDRAEREVTTPQGNRLMVKRPKRSPQELKTFLLKSQHLPKKFEKFRNFMINSMHVTDMKSQKELWEFVQKNRRK